MKMLNNKKVISREEYTSELLFINNDDQIK